MKNQHRNWEISVLDVEGYEKNLTKLTILVIRKTYTHVSVSSLQAQQTTLFMALMLSFTRGVSPKIHPETIAPAETHKHDMVNDDDEMMTLGCL